MRCPLFIMAAIVRADMAIKEPEIMCRQNHCEWYDNHEGRCAVFSAAQGLRNVADGARMVNDAIYNTGRR